MAAMDKNQLRKALEMLLAEMKKKGMLVDVKNAEQIINNVIEKVGNQITLEKLHTPEVKKGLMIGLMSESIGQNKPDAMFNYKVLFEEVNSKDELKKELSKELSKLFKKLYQLTPGAKKLPEEELDKIFNKMAESLFEKNLQKQPQASVVENKDNMKLVMDAFVQTLNLINDPAELSMRSLFGGKDPNSTDGLTYSPQVVLGNLTGIVDQSGAGNEASGTFIDATNSYQGKEDPLGMENSVKNRLESISTEIEENLEAEGVYSKAPKLKMG